MTGCWFGLAAKVVYFLGEKAKLGGFHKQLASKIIEG
jgi:hypothetical protein